MRTLLSLRVRINMNQLAAPADTTSQRTISVHTSCVHHSNIVRVHPISTMRTVISMDCIVHRETVLHTPLRGGCAMLTDNRHTHQRNTAENTKSRQL